VKPAILSKRAQRDLEKIRDRIAKENVGASRRVWNAVLDIADLLADNIEAGTKIANAPRRFADVRWFVIPQFRNYLVFYRPHQNTILVLRVLHAARDWTRFFPPS
jgi:plasmid stabilization system protein ParE